MGGSDPLAADDILDLLTRLVEQSMVQVMGMANDAVRYRLLEPVRQYCHEQLNDCGEVAATLDRHRDYYVAWGAELDFDYRVGCRTAGLFPRFEAEYDNVQVALTWCLETDAEKGLQLATNIHPVVAVVSLLGETDTYWIEAFLARTSESAPWRCAGQFRVALGADLVLDALRRKALFGQSVVLAQRAGDRLIEAMSLAALGRVLVRMGEAVDGARMADAALTLARNTGDANALGWYLVMQDWRGDPTCHIRVGECVAAFRHAGNDIGLALALQQYCIARLGGYSLDAVSRGRVDELLDLARAAGNTHQIVNGLLFLGILAEREGDLRRAAQLMEQSAELVEQGAVMRSRYEFGRLLSRLGDYERAEEVLRDFLRRGLKLPDSVRNGAFAQGLMGLALVAGSRGQYARAARLYGGSMRFRRERGLGILATEKDQHDKMVPLIQSALGESAWTSLRAEGGAMTLEQVTALAMLNEPAGAPPSQ